MAANNFRLFDENKQNMLNDQEYQASQQRLGGVQAGIASSMLNNKFSYQTSLMAYAIAQLMNANGYDATDSLEVSTFVNNLSSTMLQKIVDKATQEEAQAGISDLKWMTPAKAKEAITALAPFVQDILSDNTKALYGLSAQAVPDDVLSYLALSLTTQHGIIAVKVNLTNTIKSPITLSISPAAEVGSTVQTTEDGWFIGYAAPGTYSVKVNTSTFLTSTDGPKQVVVKAGKISGPIEFTASFLETGTLKITSSQTLTIPSFLIGKTFDLFVVGAGGGGAAGYGIGTAGGGGGGYTATKLNYIVSTSSITINIGSGGSGQTASSKGYGIGGKDGGATSIVASGQTIVSANGGSGATFGAGWGANGGSGGSGGGCGNRGAAPDGGSDGSNGKGGLSTDTNWGTGQGTTTRAFGELGGELFAGGGGGMYFGSDSAYHVGAGGSGGGGNGNRPNGVNGIAGTGGGGGGAISVDSAATGGSGGSGVAILRW